MNLLTSLAVRYLNRLQESSVAKFVAENPELLPHLKKLNVTDEGVFEGTFVTPAVALIAEDMAKMLEASGAANYYSFDFFPRLSANVRPVRVVVSWANGLSPAVKNVRLQEEVDRLRAENERLDELLNGNGYTDGERVRASSWRQLCDALCLGYATHPHYISDEFTQFRTAMRDAIENCETCRYETDPVRRCARCQTFAKLLNSRFGLGPQDA